MKFLFIAVILFTQFCAIQCNSAKKKSDSITHSSDEYFPLRNNLHWKYVNEAPGKETLIIDVVCKSAGNKFQLDKFPFFGNSDSKIEAYTDDSANIFVKDASGSTNLLLPPSYKFADGYLWIYGGGLGAYMTKTPVKVKTEAGTYECIYVVYTDGFTFSYEMWLSKGVGVVKWAATRTNPPSIPVYYVLKEFTE